MKLNADQIREIAVKYAQSEARAIGLKTNQSRNDYALVLLAVMFATMLTGNPKTKKNYHERFTDFYRNNPAIFETNPHFNPAPK